MTTGAVIVLLVFAGLYVAVHLGTLYAMKRGFRWIADRIDRWSGLHDVDAPQPEKPVEKPE